MRRILWHAMSPLGIDRPQSAAHRVAVRDTDCKNNVLLFGAPR